MDVPGDLPDSLSEERQESVGLAEDSEGSEARVDEHPLPRRHPARPQHCVSRASTASSSPSPPTRWIGGVELPTTGAVMER